ncbi:hypothetical protein OIU74_001787 [Salix koriyanagi]|uniref:Uncharacterized protein n=1 Tax=Salix koriyanagi TaxID=2511006 RepID=A0A9Q1ANV2_9ROSI|nr:hypothetical protein OIU74_001787 [Salix koriyanagi]
MENVELISTHGFDGPQNVIHGVVIPRGIQQDPPVLKQRRVPHVEPDRDKQWFRSPNQLRKRLETPHGAPYSLSRQIGGGASGGDDKGVGLVNGVLEWGGEVFDSDGQGLQSRGRVGEVDSGRNERAVELREDLEAVTVDGRGEMVVVRGGDSEVGGENRGERARPRQGSRLRPYPLG